MNKNNQTCSDIINEINTLTSHIGMESTSHTPINYGEVIKKGQNILKLIDENNGEITYETRNTFTHTRSLPNEVIQKNLVHPLIVCMGNKQEMIKLQRKNFKVTIEGLNKVKRYLK